MLIRFYKLQDLVASYERIVNEHQQYSKGVMEMQEWLEATNNTVVLWSDLDSERVSIENNLKKMKVILISPATFEFCEFSETFDYAQNLEQSLPKEKYRVDEIRNLGEKILPGTSNEGKANITKQIDTFQQDWETLVTTIK